MTLIIFFRTTEDKQKEKLKEKDRLKTERQEKLDRRAKRREHEEQDEDDDAGEGWTSVTGGIAVLAEKMKLFSKDTEINHEAVQKKIYEIFSARGKKGTNRTEQINLLIELRRIADVNELGAAMDIKILFHIVSSIFDYSPNVATNMRDEMWEKYVSFINAPFILFVSCS